MAAFARLRVANDKCNYFVGAYSDFPTNWEDRKKRRAPMFTSNPPPFLSDAEQLEYADHYLKLIDSLNIVITKPSLSDFAPRARLVLWEFWYDSRALWESSGFPTPDFSENDGLRAFFRPSTTGIAATGTAAMASGSGPSTGAAGASGSGHPTGAAAASGSGPPAGYHAAGMSDHELIYGFPSGGHPTGAAEASGSGAPTGYHAAGESNDGLEYGFRSGGMEDYGWASDHSNGLHDFSEDEDDKEAGEEETGAAGAEETGAAGAETGDKGKLTDKEAEELGKMPAGMETASDNDIYKATFTPVNGPGSPYVWKPCCHNTCEVCIADRLLAEQAEAAEELQAQKDLAELEAEIQAEKDRAEMGNAVSRDTVMDD